MRKAVAVDFDGTLCVTDFPTIIEPIPEAIEFVKQCNQAGVAVILWTCRTGKHLEEALEWCNKQGIMFDAVNANLPDWIEEWENSYPGIPADCRKVAADLYIDDKANDRTIDWKELDTHLSWWIEMGVV